MDIHIRNFHDDNKKYDCDLCGHQVSRKNSLARHKKIVHEGVKFPYGQCNRNIENVYCVNIFFILNQSNFKFPYGQFNRNIGNVYCVNISLYWTNHINLCANN